MGVGAGGVGMVEMVGDTPWVRQESALVSEYSGSCLKPFTTWISPPSSLEEIFADLDI